MINHQRALSIAEDIEIDLDELLDIESEAERVARLRVSCLRAKYSIRMTISLAMINHNKSLV